MKRNILCTLAVMAACAILVACGKTDDQISPITPESNAASSEAEATPEPTPTLPPYEANVLTGEAKGENYPGGPRITALMVNNLVDARPQRGLSKAQMLFEIKVEGGITRFMPVFNDYHDIDEIGPIRSGRDQFFQLILHAKKQLDQQLLIQFIQLFFCVLRCHNQNSLSLIYWF